MNMLTTNSPGCGELRGVGGDGGEGAREREKEREKERERKKERKIERKSLQMNHVKKDAERG
jgi:hypothetical protein